MKKLRIFNMFILLIVCSFLFQLTQAQPNPADKNDSKPIYLYIQTAKFAEIHYNSSDKSYSLVLQESDPWIISFTNAPDKESNFMDAKKFIIGFKKDLETNNPDGLNAGLIALDIKTNKMSRYTFTLTTPKYDKITHQASYTAHVIPGPQVTPLPHSCKLKHVALFIDGCAACGGGGF